MNQKSMQSFESACGKAKIYVETDMAIGSFHDFLMLIKGVMVDRMIAAHKQQIEEIQAQQNEENILPQEELKEACGS